MKAIRTKSQLIKTFTALRDQSMVIIDKLNKDNSTLTEEDENFIKDYYFEMFQIDLDLSFLVKRI